MKRRNWKRKQRSALRGRNTVGPLAKRSPSKRKTWSFERLEDRHYFSATPLDTNAASVPDPPPVQTATLSNSTPEGAALIYLSEQDWNELQWESMQSSGASQTNTVVPLSLSNPPPGTLPNDPLFASQWHLLNTGQEVGTSEFQALFGVAGQDINVVPVWQMTRDDGGVGYTGKGVLVAVIDSGVQTTHPDLAENISPTLRFNAITGTNNASPTLIDPITGAADPLAGHGTSVAGLIGAVWDNQTGGVGVAPNVTLVPIKLIAAGQTDDSIVQAFQYALDHDVDITNNSWGFPGRQIVQIPTQIYDVLRESAVFGRDGLGMINVFASGNDGGPGVLGGQWASASYSPFVNSRYVIGVTGVDHDGMYANADGTFTSYPEVGADVLVAAPTGSNVAQDVANDTGQGSGLWTTDLVGDFGFNAAPLPNGFDRDRDPLADPDYTSRFNGTSGAAPLVSGVIALMLEANPNLTYRDVQEILVRSSRTTAWYEVPSAARGDVITSGAGAGLANGAGAGLTAGGATSGATSSPATNLGAPGGGSAVVMDFGDAPAPYPTLLADNGARHLFDNTESDATRIRLGSGPDAEPDGQPDPFALGDDSHPAGATDDEDGVFIPTLNAGQIATIAVNAPNGGVLNGWIDFDHLTNVGWGATDRVVTDQVLIPGLNLIPINVPNTAEAGPSFARFRITAAAGQGGDTVTGLALNGEVEDDIVVISNNGGFFGGFGFFGGATPNQYTTWQTNQTGVFRDPDPYFHAPGPNGNPIPPGFVSPGSGQQIQWEDPLADPSIDFNSPDQGPDTFASDPASGNDDGRQFGSHYELMPGLFANGAGYTVSQGYGAYGDQVGYAHGVVDAELAVQMAKQWSTLGQNIAPGTEKTVTTFVTPGVHVLAAEKMANNGMLIPGGINGAGGAGYAGYWNEYNAKPPAPFDPASAASWPIDTRGASYEDFVVSPKDQINVESVEVKVTVSGGSFNSLRLMLTSPDGTQSELNDYFEDSSFLPNQEQVLSNPLFVTPGGLTDPSGGGTTWTFLSNRNWGESTNGAVILNPITGEPVVGPGGDPIFRNWELHIENWGISPMNIGSIEIVWHGKDVAAPSQVLTFDPAFPAGTPGIYQTLPEGQNAWDQRWISGNDGGIWQIPMAQRIQGSVGIDTTPDGKFNYDRYVQEENPLSFGSYSAATPRADDIIRRPDFTDVNQNGIFDVGTDIARQEDFAANVVVSLYRVDKVTHQVDATPTAYFLTGADGNFYFDVDPTYTWVVRINDPEGREKLTDVSQPANYMKDYQSEWTITPDWFFAPDHDNAFGPNTLDNFDQFAQQFKPGEVLWGSNDANGDGVSTTGPMPYLVPVLDFNGQPTGTFRDPVPMAVQNINFLLKATPAELFTVTGSVFADLNQNGVFDGNDAPLPNVTVYVDANRDGAYENGETSVVTGADGKYTLPVPSTVPGTYSIGVRLPGPFWQFKQPGTGVQDVGLGLPTVPQLPANFALTAPSATPTDPPPGAQSWIMGVVFNDSDGDGVRDVGETGQAGVRVFIDANQNGIWDQNTEVSVLTASNGSFVFDNVTPTPGVDIWVDVYIANEGTADAALSLTTPTAAQGGHRVVSVGAGGAATGATFGVLDRASDDWGDLPFQTLAGDNGPHHKVVPGFQLGATNSGEVNGTASATSTADASDDGVIVVGGILMPGVNTLQVTVFGVGGVLTGWMDFNGNLQFDGDSEKLSWTENGVNLGTEADLNPGIHTLQITIPASMDQRPIAARFRWGEPGLGPTGAALIGEVEDYFFPLNPSAGDYNRDGTVDQIDFIVWQMQNGKAVAPFSGADGNGDGVVNQADYDIWRNHFGQVYPAPGAGAVALTAGDDANQNSSPSGGGLSIDDLAVIENTSSPSTNMPGSVPPTSPSTSDSQGAIHVSEQPSGTTTSSAAGTSLSSSTLLTSFVVDAGKSPGIQSTSTSVVRSSSVSSDSSSPDLLLLDQTWANTVNSSFDDNHASLYDDESHEILSTNDLALAAVLNEDDQWWNAI